MLIGSGCAIVCSLSLRCAYDIAENCLQFANIVIFSFIEFSNFSKMKKLHHGNPFIGRFTLVDCNFTEKSKEFLC